MHQDYITMIYIEWVFDINHEVIIYIQLTKDIDMCAINDMTNILT